MTERSDIEMRLATASDIESMRVLLFSDGVNDWNYLPPDGVVQELGDVRSGRASAAVLEQDGVIVGLSIFYPNFVRFPAYVSRDLNQSAAVGYIDDVVVSRKLIGQGLGTKLLTRTIEELRARGMREIFIDCHEENLASRGMIRKAGFIDCGCFDDHERRFVGSRRTCIARYSVPGAA